MVNINANVQFGIRVFQVNVYTFCMAEKKQVASLVMASSSLSKLKHFALLLLSVVLLFLTLNNIVLTITYKKQPQYEFVNVTSYIKNLQIPGWFDIIVGEINDEKIKIGFVNMDSTINVTNKIHRRAEIVNVHFDPVGDNITWSDLNPPWIDEFLPLKCPDVPMPRFENYQNLNVIVASVPRNEKCEVGGVRDVFRLQVNLIVANLLVKSRKNGSRVFAVFVDSCDPMWEIFRCDDLLWHEGNSWIYKPDLRRIKQKVLMPVGSCEHAPPPSELTEESTWRVHNKTTQSREAYVTILHSTEDYVCGAITLAQSIMRFNTTKDLVLLADNHISAKSLEDLRAAGWKIKNIERIRSSNAKKGAYNRWNYSKFRVWQLKEYDKVMFIDSDLIVTRNLDEFFIYPQLAAASNYEKHFFNSGVMLLEPSSCTFETLMKKRFVVESYNGGDQGFLNEMFTWWHRLPPKLNYLKVFTRKRNKLHQIPDDVYTIHYMGLKPWKCRKHYDCSWDWPQFKKYASNSAHEKWLDVFYAMPEKLRQYCPATPRIRHNQQNQTLEINTTMGPTSHPLIA